MMCSTERGIGNNTHLRDVFEYRCDVLAGMMSERLLYLKRPTEGIYTREVST
jgi:hypothetical protein